MTKLWGGRFEQGTHHEVERFTSSLALDSRLANADLRGSIAHAEMLQEQGILSATEGDAIVRGLRELLESPSLSLDPHAEDVHSALEAALTQKIGPVAGKLHSARSRNDQVATATRIYLREEAAAFNNDLEQLQATLFLAASGELETILPGFTHLQHAQPVSLAHHLLAYFWMFQRDRERVHDLFPRLSTLPLGSAALAGTTLPINRESVARKLGFTKVSENSLDAVSDRDFVVEFLSAAALVGTHLSRLAEELILWSTPEFGFVELSDSVTTGSSLMPQKKNPDVAELVRGRTGRLNGALVGALTMLKALPLSYNRDLQEDKVHLFEGLDTARSCVRLMTLMLSNLQWRSERMRQAVQGDQSNATDLADYLVKKGVPFRQTHEIAGRAVRLALSQNIGVEQLPLAQLQQLHPLFAADVFAALDPQTVMATRNSQGGTGLQAVKDQIRLASETLEKNRLWKLN